MKRAEIIADLYRALWLSADFESDFEADWRSVYNLLYEGKAKNLPEPVLKCCHKYLMEWQETKEEKLI